MCVCVSVYLARHTLLVLYLGIFSGHNSQPMKSIFSVMLISGNYWERVIIDLV